MGNFFRKELCLQKPAFTLALIYCGCWVLALLWFGFASWRQDPLAQARWMNLVVAMTFFYMLLSLLLVGSISVADERSLGIAAWQLTLPFSARRQWLLKIGAGLTVLGVVTLLIPGFLGLITAMVLKADFHGRIFDGWPIAIICVSFFGLVFWASTLTANMVRGAVVALITVLVLVLSGIVATWCAWHRVGLQLPVLAGLAAQVGWSPQHARMLTASWQIWSLVFLVIMVAAFLLSFRQLRYPTSVGKAFRHGLVLVVLAMLMSFWAADLRNSAVYLQMLLEVKLMPVLRLVPEGAISHPLSVKDLEAYAPVPPRLAHWIKNARVEILPGSPDRANRFPHPMHVAVVKFADGSSFSFDYQSEADARSSPVRPGAP